MVWTTLLVLFLLAGLASKVLRLASPLLWLLALAYFLKALQQHSP